MQEEDGSTRWLSPNDLSPYIDVHGACQIGLWASGDGFDCTLNNDAGTLVVDSDRNINHNLTDWVFPFVKGCEVRSNCEGLTAGFQFAVCIVVCGSAGILWDDDGHHWVFSAGEAGLGVSASTVVAPSSACDQREWGWGGDVAYGYATAGAGIAADPLPNDSGQLWDPELGNVQLRGGGGVGLRASGGPSHTRVSGC